MFKWVWLVILGLIWLVWFCVAVKDVAEKIKWAIKNREKEFYYMFDYNTYVFLATNVFLLFISSLIYWVWSL